MATITLQSPDGSTETFECDSDTFILEPGKHDWNMIWKFPAFFALIIFTLFFLIFKNEKIKYKNQS